MYKIHHYVSRHLSSAELFWYQFVRLRQASAVKDKTNLVVREVFHVFQWYPLYCMSSWLHGWQPLVDEMIVTSTSDISTHVQADGTPYASGMCDIRHEPYNNICHKRRKVCLKALCHASLQYVCDSLANWWMLQGIWYRTSCIHQGMLHL